jgi:hypothetical protein
MKEMAKNKMFGSISYLNIVDIFLWMFYIYCPKWRSPCASVDSGGGAATVVDSTVEHQI